MTIGHMNGINICKTTLSIDEKSNNISKDINTVVEKIHELCHTKIERIHAFGSTIFIASLIKTTLP